MSNLTNDREIREAGRENPPVENDMNFGREVQFFFSRVKSALPFLGLVFAKFLFQHIMKLLFYIGSAVVLYRANNGLRDQVALKSLCNKRILCGLLGITISLLISIFFSMSIFGDEKLWLRLILLRRDETELSLVDILWFACVTDLAARTVLTAMKIVVCIWVPTSLGRNQPDKMKYNYHYSPPVRNRVFGLQDRISLINDSSEDMESGGASISGSHGSESGIRRRDSLQHHAIFSGSHVIDGTTGNAGDPEEEVYVDRSGEVSLYLRKKRLSAIIDAAGLIWRSILPIPLWLNYFVSGVGAEIFPVAYLCCKLMCASLQVRAFFDIFWKFLLGHLEYGRYSTAEEIESIGTRDCSVCFEELHRPVTMSCKHVFCEHCIYEWLDKERTCPVCRAEVRDETNATAVRDSDSSASFPLMI